MANIVKSLATDKPYVQVQVAVYGANCLHVQGEGRPGNREYGIAVNVAPGESVINYLDNAPKPLKSLAKTGRMYTVAQVRPRVLNGTIHFQVNDGPGGNREYGMAFDVDRGMSPEFFQWLMEEILLGQEE